jgi:hypothetical protein
MTSFATPLANPSKTGFHQSCSSCFARSRFIFARRKGVRSTHFLKPRLCPAAGASSFYRRRFGGRLPCDIPKIIVGDNIFANLISFYSLFFSQVNSYNTFIKDYSALWHRHKSALLRSWQGQCVVKGLIQLGVADADGEFLRVHFGKRNDGLALVEVAAKKAASAGS